MKYVISIFAELLGMKGEVSKNDRITLIIALIFILLFIMALCISK